MDIEPDNYNTQIAFHCTFNSGGCGQRFKTKKYESEPYPEREWLKTHYYAECPRCKNLASQASWQIAQWKTFHDHGHFGAATPEGKAAVRKANKERPPESHKISRYNAMTHGMTAKVADTYPSRPGKYDECETCEWLNNGCGDAFHECLKKLEVFLQFHVAMKEGNGRLLGDLLARDQAGLSAIRSGLIRAIAKYGVMLETPEWIYDKEKGFKIAEYNDEYGEKRIINKLEVNPGIKSLTELIARNHTTLADMGLTPGIKEEEKTLPGYLDDEDKESVAAAQQRMSEGVESLRKLMGGRTIDGESTRLIDQGTKTDAE